MVQPTNNNQRNQQVNNQNQSPQNNNQQHPNYNGRNVTIVRVTTDQSQANEPNVVYMTQQQIFQEFRVRREQPPHRNNLDL
jgi:hypothetical protein